MRFKEGGGQGWERGGERIGQRKGVMEWKENGLEARSGVREREITGVVEKIGEGCRERNKEKRKYDFFNPIPAGVLENQDMLGGVKLTPPPL